MESTHSRPKATTSTRAAGCRTQSRHSELLQGRFGTADHAVDADVTAAGRSAPAADTRGAAPRPRSEIRPSLPDGGPVPVPVQRRERLPPLVVVEDHLGGATAQLLAGRLHSASRRRPRRVVADLQVEADGVDRVPGERLLVEAQAQDHLQVRRATGRRLGACAAARLPARRGGRGWGGRGPPRPPQPPLVELRQRPAAQLLERRDRQEDVIGQVALERGQLVRRAAESADRPPDLVGGERRGARRLEGLRRRRLTSSPSAATASRGGLPAPLNRAVRAPAGPARVRPPRRRPKRRPRPS